MNQSEDEDMDPTLDCVEIDATVREVFDGIFDRPMEQFKRPLELIKENECGLVWREENERNGKVMFHAKTFIQALTDSFPSKHPEAAKHVDGSTCDVFLQYVHEKLDESLLGQDPFEDSCKDIKELITKKILRIKGALEAQKDEQPKNTSDLEVMILKTDLLDPIHIHHALLCCQIASDCKDPEYSENSLENLEKEHLLSELSVSYENEHVPKYVMARCGDVLYVSFKGVQSHNFGSKETSYRGEISTGISEAAKKIPLKYFAREVINDKRIVFTGHSSGGAIASLVLISLLEKFKQPKSYLQSHFKCITFGLMPMADITFKRFVEATPGTRDCFCHIVLKNDIVPKLFGCFNMTHMQGKLWDLVENILKPTLEFTTKDSAFVEVSTLLKFILKRGNEFLSSVSDVIGIKNLDIFGIYYILDTSKPPEQKCLILPAEDAAFILRINEYESLRHMQSEYLINHTLKRYAHVVKATLTRDLPDPKKFNSICNTAMADNITPKINEVRFENIGEEVVAKIAGSNMWFVYNVSIEGVDGNGKDLEVKVMKSLESEVQTIMREANIVHDEQVSVRVKTHFQNPKYLPATKVQAKTTTYPVTRRQQQLAKHRPRGVIELAYLSALLERRDDSYSSKRFDTVKTFFKNAVSVVPLESLFYAIAKGKPEVMLQCCEILCGDAIPTTSQPSDLFLTGMKDALAHIRRCQAIIKRLHGSAPEVIYFELLAEPHYRRHVNDTDFGQLVRISHLYSIEIAMEKRSTPQLQWHECNPLLNEAISRILAFLRKYKKRGKRHKRHPVCNVDLEVIYPSTKDQKTHVRKMTCCKAPMTLLTDGKKELARFSEELIAEHSGFTEESTTSNTNRMMLTLLTNLRNEFETCSTLLGAFMESQVHVPLEKAGDKIAKHANSFGLSVWGLLILPFEYLNQMIGNLSEEFRQFFIDFSPYGNDADEFGLPSSENQFPYDEKLEFLVGSMKQSWTCNQNYVSYSLERQLEDQCKKRNISHDTPVDEILAQWNSNFEDETLTLVPIQYRPLVARWIKWSLMINNLRESLASETAIGVIGLVNSGKSKFVRSMFGKETVTGTTDPKRTTVPLIYNLGQDIKGMDVIDFPGVDDSDKSIPELAKLLLSLTRIIVFVVEYKRAHTESTKEWLSILERENVPVLICLTFADKLFAELMGEKGDRDIEKVKAEIGEQLNAIIEQIGQPKSGHHRDFKLTVFALDNDSKLNTDEGKEKLRKAGLNDELDVGRWIAEKLQDYEQNDVSQNVIKFIEKKEKSTLNSHRRTSSEEKSEDAPATVVHSGQVEGTSRGDQATSSTGSG